jgi:hypothetical protein
MALFNDENDLTEVTNPEITIHTASILFIPRL